MEHLMSLGILGPVGVIITSIVYFGITLSALYLILKNEKKNSFFLWLFLLFFVPFLGAVIYILRFLINKK